MRIYSVLIFFKCKYSCTWCRQIVHQENRGTRNAVGMASGRQTSRMDVATLSCYYAVLKIFLFHSWYLRSHTGSCHCHVITSCLHIKSYKLTCAIMTVTLLTGRSDACSCRKAIANCFQYLWKKKIFWKIQVASSHKIHRHKLTKKEILYTRKHGMLLWNQIVLTRFLYQLHAWAKHDTSE